MQDDTQLEGRSVPGTLWWACSKRPYRPHQQVAIIDGSDTLKKSPPCSFLGCDECSGDLASCVRCKNTVDWQLDNGRCGKPRACRIGIPSNSNLTFLCAHTHQQNVRPLLERLETAPLSIQETFPLRHRQWHRARGESLTRWLQSIRLPACATSATQGWPPLAWSTHRNVFAEAVHSARLQIQDLLRTPRAPCRRPNLAWWL